MLKSIVNGAEHDIVSIPMKGKNLSSFDAITYLNDDSYYVSYRILNSISEGSYTLSYFVNIDPSVDSLAASIGVGSTIYEKDIKIVNSIDPGYINIPFSITDADAGKNLFVRFVRSGLKFTATITITKVMLNTGSTALPYEPYGYQNGWEVRDNQNRIIWGREDELETTTGTLPFKGYDLPIKVKSLLGNSVQNGTPSPSPVNPNLVDPSKTIPGYQQSNGTIHTPSGGNERTTDWIPFTTDKLYAIVSGSNGGNINWVLYDSNKQPLYFYGPTFSPNTVIIISRSGYSAAAFIRISWTNAINQPICVTTEQRSEYIPFDPNPPGPIIPEMCGVRTDNLFDGTKYVYTSISSTERWEYATSLTGSVYRIPCKPSTTYTLYLTENVDPSVWTIWRIRDIATDSVPNPTSTSVQITGSYTSTIPANRKTTFTTSSNAKYILFQSNEAIYDSMLPVIMLVEGSTTLPYEPYGYKISFDNNGENLIVFPYYSQSGNYSGVQFTVADDGKITANGTTGGGANFFISRPIDLEIGTYTISISGKHSGMQLLIYDVTNSRVITSVSSASTASKSTFNINDSNIDIRIYFNVGSVSNVDIDCYIMLNSGSTPLPYSPYLNKTTPIYLGEVPTIRRIKKLVLTGEEEWYFFEGVNIWQFYINNVGLGGIAKSSAMSNIAPYGATTDNRQSYEYGCYLVTGGSGIAFQVMGAKDVYTNIATWKSYLAQQYQNGTPVTVWYALENPETGIVNEPLAKIGDYADELTEISVHNLSTPLYGIGDYKDILNLSTGVVTRKIKKLVLTGNENIELKSGNGRWYIPISDMKTPANLSAIEWCCSHYQAVTNDASWASYDYMISWSSVDAGSSIGLRIRDIDFLTGTTLADFKSFLAQQYQNGTPVTIWYVLATPETETVTVPTGMTGEIEGYLTQISTPTPEHPSIPKWNGKEETGGTYAVTVYNLPEIPTTIGQNKLTVDTTLAPYNVTINGHIKYTYWGKIREDVRSGLAQTKFPVGTILYDNEDETTGRAFQVVGYDKHFDPSLTARGYNHSMTLCQLKLSGPWQFDAIEAFLYTTVEMQPGTYKFKIPNYDTTYGGNKTYYFTSTASVPVDSQITLSWAYQQPPKTVTAYAGPNPQTKTTAITGFNALQLSEWIEGESPEAIDLGIIKLANNDPDSTYGKLNHIHRARYGSNNYYQSGLRQLLNTDFAANNWWHPTTIFDRPYGNRTTNGYLRSLNEDFINVLATPEITHITNNVFEYPSLDGRTFALNTEYKINTDKVFLLSHTEVGLSSSPNVGTILDYYSTHNTNSDRIKYRIDNGNAYYWWLRTPYPTGASHFRGVGTSGALSYNNASGSYGVAPAHIIQ